MIKSCETSYLYVVIANGITTELCANVGISHRALL